MDTPCAKRRSRWAGILPALAVFLVVVTPAGTGQVPASAQTAQEPGRIDGEALVRDLSVIAADSMAGRLAGSDGGRRAGEYLLSRLVESGTVPVGGARTQTFPLGRRATEGNTGVNVLGMIPVSSTPGGTSSSRPTMTTSGSGGARSTTEPTTTPPEAPPSRRSPPTWPRTRPGIPSSSSPSTPRRLAFSARAPSSPIRPSLSPPSSSM